MRQGKISSSTLACSEPSQARSSTAGPFPDSILLDPEPTRFPNWRGVHYASLFFKGTCGVKSSWVISQLDPIGPYWRGRSRLRWLCIFLP